MEWFDKVLDLLKNSRWHRIEEIKAKTSLSAEDLSKVLCFLQEQGFINKKNGKMRITSMGLEFLELPTYRSYSSPCSLLPSIRPWKSTLFLANRDRIQPA